MTEGTPELTPFQLEVSRLFFSLPASRGFLLAGGAALLARRFGRDTLLARAAHIDAGFDTTVLAEMFADLDRVSDHDIPLAAGTSPADLRAFFQTWRSELTR